MEAPFTIFAHPKLVIFGIKIKLLYLVPEALTSSKLLPNKVILQRLTPLNMA